MQDCEDLSQPSMTLTYHSTRHQYLLLDAAAVQELLGGEAPPQLRLKTPDAAFNVTRVPERSGLQLSKGWSAVRRHLRLQVFEQ